VIWGFKPNKVVSPPVILLTVSELIIVILHSTDSASTVEVYTGCRSSSPASTFLAEV
jgi:hypothetical protein